MQDAKPPTPSPANSSTYLMKRRESAAGVQVPGRTPLFNLNCRDSSSAVRACWRQVLFHLCKTYARMHCV